MGVLVLLCVWVCSLVLAGLVRFAWECLRAWFVAWADPPAWPGRCRGCIGPRFGARSCRRLPGGGCEFRF